MTFLTTIFTDLLNGADTERFVDYLIRLVLNSVSIFILIRYIFYPNNGQSEFFFTYFLMGLIVFTIASTFDNLKI